MRLSLLVPAAALLLSSAACVHVPEVTLDHAELNGVQMAAVFPPRIAISLTVVVNVTNTNSFDIAIRGMRGQAIMADKYPLPIMYQAPPPGIWLRAGQTTPMRLPVDMPVELAIAMLREALGAPVIPYHVVGVVDVTGTTALKIARDNYPVDLHGTMTRQQVEGVVPAFMMPH